MSRAHAARASERDRDDDRAKSVDDDLEQGGAQASFGALKDHQLRCEVDGKTEGDLAAILGRQKEQQYQRGVTRAESIERTAQEYYAGIMGSLVPAYVAARDAIDVEAVSDLGTRILGGLTVLGTAHRTLLELLEGLHGQSFVGADSDAATDLDFAQREQDLRTRSVILQSMVPTTQAVVAAVLTPQRFRGEQVAGVGVVVSIGEDDKPGQVLGGELARTIAMLDLARELRGTFADPAAAKDKKLRWDAEERIRSWRGRPIDLAFLRAALGPVWNLLDSAHTELSAPAVGLKPSDLMGSTEQQAKDTGWAIDLGAYDPDLANTERMIARAGGKSGAENLFHHLMTAPPEGRAALLRRMSNRDELAPMLELLGWQYAKTLHDSLPNGGHGDVKQVLQDRFLREGEWGTSLEHQDEKSASLKSMIGELGDVGDVMNVALDVGTFGFHSAYGDARDAHVQGLTTDKEYYSAVNHAVLKTAAVAAISLASGGAADKFVRGGAATVSAGRSIAAGTVGGAVGGVADVGASDLYDIHVSGTKDEFSSPEDYVKAALLGGALGGGFSAVSEGLGAGARYLRRGSGAADDLGRTADDLGHTADDTIGRVPDDAVIAKHAVELDGTHHLKVVQRGGRAEVMLCSDCGPLREKLQGLLGTIPADDANRALRGRVNTMFDEVLELQRGLNEGTIAESAVEQRLAALGDDLERLHAKHHIAGENCTFCRVDRQLQGEFSLVERQVIDKARSILSSTEIDKIRAAHARGEPVVVTIDGVKVQYEPVGISGMTMFDEHGFIIGKDAFNLGPDELAKTVLHELHRLATSQSAAGVHGGLSSQEASAAQSFSDRAFKEL